jgi:hypothetical protein
MRNSKLKQLFLIIGILFLWNNSFGQYNMTTFYDNQHDVNAARLFPSELDLGNHHLQVGFDYDLWVGNNTFDYGSVQDLNSNSSINNSQVNNIISKLKGNNILGFGQDIQVLSVAYEYITPKDEKHVVFTFSVDDKVATDMVMSQNLVRLFWQGNAQFAGQNVTLSPFAINADYTREYALGTSFTVLGDEHEKELRIGVRLKYIQGFGSVFMSNKNFSIYTQRAGDTVAVGFDYNINTSRTDNNFNLFNPSGSGAGLDFSISYYPSSSFTFAAGMTNLNYMTYNKDVVTYSKTGVENYTGAIIQNLFGDIQFNPNQLTSIFLPTTTNGGSFKVPFSPNVNLLAEYQQMISDNKKGDYAQNSIFLNYIQGFVNEPGSTVNPYISAGYTHGFVHTLNLGVATSYGGYNRYTFGPLASIYWSRKRFSIGSDNLGGLLFSHIATGVDLTVHFTATFF